MKRLAILLAIAALISMSAPTPSSEVRAGSKCVIPKDWGRVVAAWQVTAHQAPNLVFEAADGTIRTVDMVCKTPAKPDWEAARE